MRNKLLHSVLLFLFTINSFSMAAYIEFEANDLGNNIWEYTYTLGDFSPNENDGFTIYFDYGLYENLTVGTVLDGWDAIAWDPDDIYGWPDDGAFDAIALEDDATTDQSFTVSFNWLGAAEVPGEQYFEIYNDDPFSGFSIIETGITQAQATSVPEPMTFSLLFLGIFGLLCTSARRRKKKVIPVILLMVFLGSSVTHAQQSNLSIDNYQLVSKTRVGRTVYQYEFKADVNNTGPDVQNVTAALVSASPYTTVIDNTLSFGEVPSESTIQSYDSFVIRQNRRYPFDASALQWNITHAPIVKIEFGSIDYSPNSFFYTEAVTVQFNVSVITMGGVNIVDVTLFETDENGIVTQELTKLYDNGNLSIGDDIALDGVFSNRFTFQDYDPGNISLKIEAVGDKDGNPISSVSDIIIIEVLEHISDAEYAEALAMPDEAKARFLELKELHGEDIARTETVAWLELKPEIGKAGISETGKGIWWVLESGILGGMFLGPEGTKGGIGSNAALSISPYYNDFAPPAGDGDDSDGAFNEIQNSECPVFSCSGPFRNAAGTVESFKTLSNYGIIIISSHGDNWYNGILSWWQDRWGNEMNFFQSWMSQAVIKTATIATAANKTTYEKDLKNHRLAITTSNRLAILPGFIKHYNKNFPSSLVYMSSCRSSYNTTLSNAFISNGAKTYFGYNDYVDIGYAFNCGITLFQNLLEGKTAKEAFDQVIIDRGACGPAGACFQIQGDNDLTIAENGIVNGGFEENLTGWDGNGDTRVITRLGPLTPSEGNHMAIISTGLGSVNNSNSAIRQSFCIGETYTNLSFDYNVVSEEPMEWVGTQYDDKFQVYVVMPDNNTQLIAQESVNGSSWSIVHGIDFYGGDNTTYMTGWKHIDIDISAWPDAEAILFEMRTWDVGDSQWDTAALIDNIILYEQ